MPQRRHLKSRYPQLNVDRLTEKYATDTWFAKETSLNGENCAQMFYGLESSYTECIGMTTESEGPQALTRFIRERGAMPGLRNDCSKMQTSDAWNDILVDQA